MRHLSLDKKPVKYYNYYTQREKGEIIMKTLLQLIKGTARLLITILFAPAALFLCAESRKIKFRVR